MCGIAGTLNFKNKREDLNSINKSILNRDLMDLAI